MRPPGREEPTNCRFAVSLVIFDAMDHGVSASLEVGGGGKEPVVLYRKRLPGGDKGSELEARGGGQQTDHDILAHPQGCCYQRIVEVVRVAHLPGNESRDRVGTAKTVLSGLVAVPASVTHRARQERPSPAGLANKGLLELEARAASTSRPDRQRGVPKHPPEVAEVAGIAADLISGVRPPNADLWPSPDRRVDRWTVIAND